MVGKKHGFTILEVLAVMAILAVLIALATRGMSLAKRQARESQAKADIELLRNALEEFRVEYGRYPDDMGAISDVVRNMDTQQARFLTNAVDGLRFKDPWGGEYQYLSTNRFVYKIWSAGPDIDSAADDIDPSKSGY